VDIGGHLVKFFSTGKTDPRYPDCTFYDSTLGDFLRDHLHIGYGARLRELSLACQRLEEQGYLFFITSFRDSRWSTSPSPSQIHVLLFQ